MKPRALQIKSVWHTTIEHIISKCGVNQEVHVNNRDEHEHMFTYPFRTVDNSFHSSCKGLAEFSHHSRTDGVHGAVHGINNIASSIIIDKNWLGLLLLEVTWTTRLSIFVCLGKQYISHSPLSCIVF